MPEDLVTNADDVEVTIETIDENLIRVVGQDFTITAEQTINSISGLGQNTPKGLTKGDIEYTFEFTIQGEDTDIMDAIADSDGDSIPFDMTASKPDEDSDDVSFRWEFDLTTCLADTEEVSGTTGEAIEYSVEGMAVGLDRTIT